MLFVAEVQDFRLRITKFSTSSLNMGFGAKNGSQPPTYRLQSKMQVLLEARTEKEDR